MTAVSSGHMYESAGLQRSAQLSQGVRQLSIGTDVGVRHAGIHLLFQHMVPNRLSQGMEQLSITMMRSCSVQSVELRGWAVKHQSGTMTQGDETNDGQGNYGPHHQLGHLDGCGPSHPQRQVQPPQFQEGDQRSAAPAPADPTHRSEHLDGRAPSH